MKLTANGLIIKYLIAPTKTTYRSVEQVNEVTVSKKLVLHTIFIN